MAKPEPDPLGPAQVAGPEAEPAAAPRESGRARPPAVCYLGFQATKDGREYTLRVSDGREPRLFVLLITHEAFASRAARFQDAPDICFGKLQRELLADPDLVPCAHLLLTARDLLEYRIAGQKRTPVRKRRQPGS